MNIQPMHLQSIRHYTVGLGRSSQDSQERATIKLAHEMLMNPKTHDGGREFLFKAMAQDFPNSSGINKLWNDLNSSKKAEDPIVAELPKQKKPRKEVLIPNDDKQKLEELLEWVDKMRNDLDGGVDQDKTEVDPPSESEIQEKKSIEGLLDLEDSRKRKSE